METCSSGEDLVIKTRKPYTITKQRERWTEEEHNRFLEALKLYGRAWQRIEEYIGTKTAVQIRSHAQKFFTKLEKEAFVKGISIGQALDIEIPPPRPKRKPSNPYPRKTGVGSPTSQVGTKDGKLLPSVSSPCPGKEILDLEREPLPEKPDGVEKLESANGDQDEENCSEVFTFLQEASCNSSARKISMSTPVAPGSSCTFREFVPMMKEANQDETSESHVTTEPKGNKKFVKLDTKQPIQDNGTLNISISVNHNLSHEKSVQDWTTDEHIHPENFSSLLSDDMQAMHNYPRHVPVQVLDGSVGANVQNVSRDKSYHESMFQQIGGVNVHPNLYANPAASATTENQNGSRSSVHQSFPTFHPLSSPVQNSEDDFRSFFHISSTFSSLIVSTLLQNPAAHSAASFAASFWPYANVESSADSLSSFTSPNMAAIAAATVAAATAWWASHGLLSLCSPFQTGLACNPASTTDTGQTVATNNDRRENIPCDHPLQHQQLNPQKIEAKEDNALSASKSPTLSSLDFEEGEGGKVNGELTCTSHEKVAGGVNELHDSNNAKSRKPVDRSSSGSNTPSGSEPETDALEKCEKGNEESKEADAIHPAGDSSNRRGRSSSNMNDSWKEVSQGGRLAFQALFSRQVLPQSFSPPHDMKSNGHQKNSFEMDKLKAYEKNEDGSLLDLNSGTESICSSHQRVENKNAFLVCDNNAGGGLLTMPIGQGKPKAHRTGFKPYKRCSVEAEESRVPSPNSQGEAKGPKRIRLHGEAST